MKMSPKLLPLLLLALSCLAAALLIAFPVAGVCVTPASVYIQGWISGVVKWLYWPTLLVLSVLGLVLRRFAGRRFVGSRLAALAPLAWLPLLVMLPHGLASLDRTFAGLILPLGGTFLSAICVERAIRPWFDSPQKVVCHSGRAVCTWFVASFLLLLAFHYGVSQRQGFGSGDVKHYAIQVANLVEHGNLDLTDRIEAQMKAAGVADDSEMRASWLEHSHMKVNTSGRVFSYHTFGFPLLLWPFRILFGHYGDGIFLALIAALALCGVRSACLVHGAPRPAADVVTLLTGFSYMWVYTAMSFLPEMLGFALGVWGFWAVAAQERPRWRWIATVVAIFSCAYLPVAHIRFTPAAGMLAASFGVEGLFLHDEPFWRQKVPRLALFSSFCMASWLALWGILQWMFRGTAPYDYSQIAGRVPIMMWAMFSDRHGVISVVPAVSAFLVAVVVALFRHDAIARRAVMALSVVAATLWFCCSTFAAMGEACLNGRYFYPVIPFLLPFFAMALARATHPGRVWLLFLALLPVLYLLFLAPFLNGARLVHAPAPARGFLSLALFWEPFPSFFGSTPSSSHLRMIGSLFSATLFGLSLIACTRSGPVAMRRGLAAMLLLAAFVLGRSVDHGATPRRLGAVDVLLGTRHFQEFRILNDHPDDYFSSFRPPMQSSRSIYVLTDDLERPCDDVSRLQHPADLPIDDWRGRPLRWGKSRAGFISLRGGEGYVAARATGRVIRGTAHLALQVGGVPEAPDIDLSEGPFDVVFFVRVFQGNRGFNFRLALDDDIGEAIIDTTEYVPCPPPLISLLGGFPPSARVVEWDGQSKWDG